MESANREWTSQKRPNKNDLGEIIFSAKFVEAISIIIAETQLKNIWTLDNGKEANNVIPNY